MSTLSRVLPRSLKAAFSRRARSASPSGSIISARNMSIWSSDIQQFQSDYPRQRDNPSANDNLLFYQNELRCRPDGKLIDEIHQEWKGDYDKLEQLHGYIQWLFPIREHGVNWDAQPLQLHERDAMRADPRTIERVLESYKLMLDFFGMQLADSDTGLLQRSENYARRYRNLLNHPHNYLRISRILKHLSEMNLEHLSPGFLLFILKEQSEHGELSHRMLIDSMDRFWRGCIRDADRRQRVGTVILSTRGGEQAFDSTAYEKFLDDERALTDSAIKSKV